MSSMMTNQVSDILSSSALQKSIDPKLATIAIVGIFVLKLADIVTQNGYELDFKASSDGTEIHLRKPEKSDQ